MAYILTPKELHRSLISFWFQSDLAYEMETGADTLQDIMNNYIEVETGLEVYIVVVVTW